MYDHYRRIFTDGRDWPKDLIPSLQGYSIGKWIDEERRRHLRTCSRSETVASRGRALRRARHPSSLRQSIGSRSASIATRPIRRSFHDVITTIDHALKTPRPWTVDKKYVRNPDPRPVWIEYDLMEANAQVMIGKENYFLKRGWAADAGPRRIRRRPDVRYFIKRKK